MIPVRTSQIGLLGTYVLNSLFGFSRLPSPNLNPRSALVSSQLVVNTSADTLGAFVDFLVITLMTPPIASLPYKVEAGPLIISIRSTREFGIPEIMTFYEIKANLAMAFKA